VTGSGKRKLPRPEDWSAAVVSGAALLGLLVGAWGAAPLASAPSAAPPEDEFPLREAILAGDQERARQLIEEGAWLAEGLVPAARTGSVELLQLLLDSGAEATGFTGARALLVAHLSGQKAAVGALAAVGATLEATDEAGETALVWAAGLEHPVQLVRAAIRGGADLNAASRTGETALMTAVRHRRRNVVRMLRLAGADLQAVDRDGWSALMFAVRAGDRKVVSSLLRAGANPNAQSTLGWTPLMLAVWEADFRIIQRLLRAGADPNRASQLGDSPLIRALQRRDLRVVRTLLENGANPGLGKSGALWWARGLGFESAERLLLEARRRTP
jgi:ankyrin repeat protein